VATGSWSPPWTRRIGALSDYYQLRNRVRFTMKFQPFFLPTVALGFIVVIVNRILRGQWKRIPVVLKALFSIPYGDK
jgi:hypothetical protein